MSIIKRLWDKIRSVAGPKRARAESRRKQAESEAAEFSSLLEEENEGLKAKLAQKDKEIDDLVEMAEADRKRDQDEIQDLRGKLHHAQRQNQALVEKSLGQQEPVIPNSLTGLKEWAEQNLAGSVELHGRALRGAKDSQYKDPALIYKTLLLLRDYYVPMRRKGSTDFKDFKKRCQELGVKMAKTGIKLRLKEQKEEYCIDVGGKPRLMDLHLKKGASRAPRDCFRLYFLWDEKNELVVVGWLPSHLTTRAS